MMIKDIFDLFMIVGSELCGELEMPYIGPCDGPIPTSVTDYAHANSSPEDDFVHFYMDDYLFDGRNGVWHGLQESNPRFAAMIRKLHRHNGVISPDFSVYVDMPLVQQFWNIYRGRSACVYLRSIGISTIFNVRWGDERTYDVAFSYISKRSVLAVGSHGMTRSKASKAIFIKGFREMVRRLEPSVLIVYGAVIDEMREVCDAHYVTIFRFDRVWKGGE